MADFTGARNCFMENCNLIGPDPMADPQNWNLNNGLEQFAAAVQADLAAIQHTLHQILSELRQR